MSSPFAATILKFPTGLIPKSSDIGVTNFNARSNDWHAPGEIIPRTGPIRTTPIPFRLIANAAALVIAAQDPARMGVIIQNKDPTDILYIGFGTLASANEFEVQPKQTVLFDFVAMTDTISVFSTVDLSGWLGLLARQSE